MAEATLLDHTNRLQHFICCIATKGFSLSKRLRLGTDCCCETDTLNLLLMYFNALSCYNPALSTNCLTQVEVDAMWDDISRRCGICFAPYGSIYATASTCRRITENFIRRITESGIPRITETC